MKSQHTQLDTQFSEKPSVFCYDNYRLFLKDWFTWQKNRGAEYSYRIFSEAAGFKSPNQLLLIIQAKRNITTSSLPRFCRVLDLGNTEKKYFSKLVRFNQSASMTEKKQRLSQLSKKFLQKDFFLKKEQYHYLSNWYYTAIREMVTLKNFRENGDWIAKKLNQRITPRQALKAIRVLLKLKLLARDSKKKLIQTQHYVTTGNEVQNVAAFLYHDQMINIAGESLKTLTDKQRNLSSLSFTMRQQDYEMIEQEIIQFRKRLVSLLMQRDSQQQDEDLFQLNVHLFPLTRNDL